MKDLFVPYKIAKKLLIIGFEDGGFSGHVFAQRTSDGSIYFDPEDFSFESDYLNTPLYQQVVDWFRENHGIVISSPDYFKDEWYCAVYNLNKPLPNKTGLSLFHTNSNSGDGCKTYKQSLDKGILDAIKLIKK